MDEAVRVAPRLDAMLSQARDDPTSMELSFSQLAQALGHD